MTARCPVPHGERTAPLERTGLLLGDPYARVAAAFDGFTRPLGTERGGIHTDKTPQSDTGRARAPDYDVQKTFTPEQEGYVEATIVALNMLAQGRPLGRSDTPVASFAERVVDNFLRQERGTASFGTAILDSTLALYDDFGRLHSNLTPALSALSTIGGLDGLDIVSHNARNHLNQAIDRGLTRKNANTALAYLATSGYFVQEHPFAGQEPAQFEVQCPGQAVAKNLLRQSAEAAARLAAVPGLPATYDTSPEVSFMRGPEKFRPQLEAKIAAIAAHAAEAHARGELA